MARCERCDGHSSGTCCDCHWKDKVKDLKEQLENSRAANDLLRLDISESRDQVVKLEKENRQLQAAIGLAKDGLHHIKKHALWGVEANCDAVLANLEEK